jgi:adenosylcobinamide kinase/adenosylcobinamide-phosphate guanylyltransferase
MQEKDRKTVTLVLGGARSGKSSWAQSLAEKFERVVYVATAVAFDDEMRAKIRRHRDDRPKHWHTIEEPLDLAKALTSQCAPYDLILVDCLTVFVGNLLGAEETDPGSMERRITHLLEALRTASTPIVLVSNEVGCGVVPAYPLGRQYRDALGELNQRVGQIADNVLFMIAGFPMALKGIVEARS